MSRSRRHTPISGITGAESEKKDKKIANKQMRTRTRDLLRAALHADEEEDLVFPDHLHEVSNPYSGDKDGKHYYGNHEEEEWFRKMMRK